MISSTFVVTKGNYDLAILSRLDKGVEKTKEKGSLEDINLFLIGGGESRSLYLGVAQIVREAETG